MARRLFAWVLGLLLFAMAGEAAAHTRSTSYSWWRVDGNAVEVRWTVSARDLTAAPGIDPRTRLRLEGGGCVAGEVHERREPAGVAYHWQIRCPRPASRLVADALFDSIPAHVHFARVGEREHVLTSGERAVSLDQATSWTAFARLGVRHVLGGWDHLVFLLALTLLVRSRRSLLWLASGFTLGHAVSLSLAASGTLHAHVPTVEALIGASIVLVAAEIGWARRRDRGPIAIAVVLVIGTALLGAWRHTVRPWALVGLAVLYLAHLGWSRGAAERAERSQALVTVAFGALHGLGFAGALGVLSGDNVAAGLVGFNLGVELGQLGVVLLALGTLHLLRLRHQRTAHELGAAVAACAGVFWLLVRAL